MANEKQMGKLFEKMVIDILVSMSKFQDDPFKAVRNSSPIQDKNEGTDLFYQGIRIDITLNFDGKVCTKKIGESYERDSFGSVRFGLRSGNGLKFFSEPVLVIGFDLFSIPVSNKDLDNLAECFYEFDHEYGCPVMEAVFIEAFCSLPEE